MLAEERAYIKKKFAKYYGSAELSISSISQREFGIGNIKKIDSRHLSFATKEELMRYLVSNPPMFLSHSASYYNHPDATPMERKGWLGCDLIFDFDAHTETKYGAYSMLEDMKKDCIRLIEDFLVSDFGITKKYIKTVFSGNRGYHVHVNDTNFLDLNGDERREITDYINGIGLKYENFFEDIGESKAKPRLLGPKPDEGGYRGRFVRELIKELEKNPKAIDRKLSTEKEGKMFIEAINEGNWNKTSVKDLIHKLAPVAQKLPLHSVNADAGVSYDVSKLIRAPNSLHGDTGLIAKVVENIDVFEPLKDAFIQNKEKLNVKFLEDVPKIEIANETYEFKKDDEKELPESVAIFFVLKGSCNLIFGSK